MTLSPLKHLYLLEWIERGSNHAVVLCFPGITVLLGSVYIYSHWVGKRVLVRQD